MKSSIATTRAPARLRSVNFAPSADERGYPVCRGIGMAEGSANRAAIANGAIGDIAGNAPHGAAGDVRNAPILDVGMGDAGAEHEFVAATLDLLELGKPGDVDDQFRLHQPQIEHRAQATGRRR